MSFAKEQKTDILLVIDKSACCRRATLLGVIAAKAYSDGEFLNLTLDCEATVSYVSALIQEFYTKIPEFVHRENGGRGKMIRFDSKSATKYIANLKNNDFFEPKCASCTASFLRGVYLASGRLADPTKQHHFELAVLSDRIEAFCNYFAILGLDLSIANRAGEQVLYSRRSDTIEDFFALAGMNNTVFKLMNSKINSEVRNNANRVSNCETNNISKAVDAASRQVALIKELERRNILGSLPEELLLTAKMRVRYEDMSLSQLALLMSPPISKSGLSHRLKKLTVLAEALIADNDKI